MRILVAGGGGFIGSHLDEKFLAGGHSVAILDDFNDFYDPQIKRANIAALSKDVPVHHVDLRENAAVRNLFHREKFDTIAHLAARAGVRPSIQHPQLYYDTNVTGTLHLLDAARAPGVERFIFASSSSVYGVSKTVPFSEEQHLTQTISPYAATKLAAEFLCSTYSHLYKLRVVALRYFTVYGPRPRPDLAIHQFTKKIHAGQPIDQFGDGPTRRDYTYIDEILHGTRSPLPYSGRLFDIFNLGESETIQLKDLIEKIEKALGKKAKINQLPEQPGDVPLTCADISKARKLLGYNPTTQLSEGLPHFIEWFMQRASLTSRSCRSRNAHVSSPARRNPEPHCWPRCSTIIRSCSCYRKRRHISQLFSPNTRRVVAGCSSIISRANRARTCSLPGRACAASAITPIFRVPNFFKDSRAPLSTPPGPTTTCWS